jgi:hypothetical protein
VSKGYTNFGTSEPASKKAINPPFSLCLRRFSLN